jgi:cell division protein FtsN
MKIIFIIVSLILIQLSNLGLFAQKEEVTKNLRLVAYGRIDEVRAIIPDLLAKYPDDPGVKLLHGTILEDAFLALEVYQGILKNYPESPWADHAYWRIVQFYAVLGDTAKAQAELANFRSRYPASTFIGPASDVVRSSVSLARKSLKNVTSIPSQQSSATSTIAIKKDETPKINVVNPENLDVNINPDKIAATTDLSENKQKLPETPIAKLPTNGQNNIERLNPGRSTHSETTTVKPDQQVTTKPEVKNEVVLKKDLPVQITSEEPEFFGLQVGIYKDKNTAESEKNKFLVRRLRTQVVEKEVGGTIMFAVVIGHYSSIDSAEEGKKIVSIQCGCEPIIYKK